MLKVQQNLERNHMHTNEERGEEEIDLFKAWQWQFSII